MVLIIHGVTRPFKSNITILEAVAKHLNLSPQLIRNCDIVRRSIDARKRVGKRKDIRLVYNVHVTLDNETEEESIVSEGRGKLLESVFPYSPSMNYRPSTDTVRPIVIGSGPAGLFAAYTLLQSGYKPIVIEQGPRVERRSKDLMNFWKHNVLSPHSNGVFGEGGAGAFSDGKLTTRTSSPYHRFVHETLIEHGAKPNVLYESRAHIGTDQLRKIISNFSRDGISDQGAVFLYNTEFRRLLVEGGEVRGVQVRRVGALSEEEVHEWTQSVQELSNEGRIAIDKNKTNNEGHSCVDITSDEEVQSVRASEVFLATGHSARDVYQHLHEAGVALVPKDFAIGLRLQVPQHAVNALQYGEEEAKDTARQLGAAEFTYKFKDPNTGRVVYTFCMCPGGVVVNASHGGEEVAVNGMSYSTRASRFANAAFVVTVGGDDFDPKHSDSAGGETEDGGALSGMHFQKYWEQRCFRAGGGEYGVPAQRAIDYIRSHPLGRSFQLGASSVAQKSNNSRKKNNTALTRGSSRKKRKDKNQNGSEKGPATGEHGSGGKASDTEDVGPLPDHIFMGSLVPADLHSCLPEYVNTALVSALMHFSRTMPGLLGEDSLLMGIESRTSSPVRISRDDDSLESTNTKGLYPLGEGAGYAGGIMTACVDGVRAAEAMVRRKDPAYVPPPAAPPGEEERQQGGCRTGKGKDISDVYYPASW